MRIEQEIHLVEQEQQLVFIVRQMSAFQLERWLERALRILPPDQPGLATHPIKAAQYILHQGLLLLACRDPLAGTALLEELLLCCKAVEPITRSQIPCSADKIDQLVESAETLLLLRQAALRVNLDFALAGARQYLTLPKASAFERAKAQQNPGSTVNIPQLTSSLISHGAASLHDLQTTYSYGDALDLLEIVNVRNYNQWTVYESAKQGKRC